ncbi:MAG: methyltransferase domain-containing protein [Candidatus Vogelbacteria bacterium]|nr:methyltransferase domain-containing protein [Candidatus Vogelbacteria bacterium]
MEQVLFLKSFLKNWKEVGSITPSSRFLAERLLDRARLREARVVVELGAGLGTITKRILRHVGAGCRIVTFEINPLFCERLRRFGDSRLEVVNDSALALGDYLREARIDYLVSGLPLATLGRPNKRVLLRQIHQSLAADGRYVQFQYSLESYRELKSVFSDVRLTFALLNTPPAFIYQCTKHLI